MITDHAAKRIGPKSNMRLSGNCFIVARVLKFSAASSQCQNATKIIAWM
jgi:hypothetical protein